jgi:four helix bundle protein
MGGFNFICEADFIRALLGFHRVWRDFIEKLKNSWYNHYKEVIIMAENKLADMSTEFAIQILKLTDNIKGHYSLANQLERSGTSIGANIREAKYAHSRPDFIAKLQIALKECYETEYWIEIAQKAELISKDYAKTILHDCGSIRRMLISSINTAKENTK